MDLKLLPIYFAIGGIVVSAVTYFGSMGKGMLAAFIALLPTMTVITLCTVYFSGGTENAVSYAKNMLLLLPPWVLYIIGVIFLLPRIGLLWALVVSIAVYLGTSFLIMKLIG